MNLLGSTALCSVEAHLAGILDRLPASDDLHGLTQALRRFVLAGGKRLRPQLCLWTFQQSRGNHSNDQSKPPVLDLACAWELFHAFLLIHDDVIDGADHRRDQPSLHRQLQALDHHCPIFGRNLAIVAGDLLFSTSLRLFHDLDIPPETYRELLRLFSRIACTTGFGQAIDICQTHRPMEQVCEQTLLREYHWKTAAYTFEGPMLSGALLAGIDGPALEAVSRFALALGQAYQMHNDLVDLAREAHEGCDLIQGKRTITLMRYRAMACDAERAEFDRRLAALPNLNGQAVAEAERLRRELHASDAPQQTRALIADYLTDARHAAAAADLPIELAAGLAALLDCLRTSYFVTV